MSRIVFLGTPEAAVTVLDRIADRVDLVVTMPDRPSGRSRSTRPPAVKERALDLGIPVVQPEHASEVAGAIAGYGPFDLGVVVAYGMLLDEAALDVSRLGHVNVHFSLLPRWRGAAPVQAALLSGDERTGVSLMQLERGLDTGPVFSVVSLAIRPDDNAGTLTARLAVVGARLLSSELAPILEGRRFPGPQPGSGASYAPKIGPADRPLDFARHAVDLARQVRALAPMPGATANAGERTIRILAARATDRDIPVGQVRAELGSVFVGTGSGSLVLDRVQPAGGRSMTAADWYRGHRPESLS